ncbi:zinc metalloproteinase nas-4-like [Topomyia yanbarensis]|uniref:zinc metalloproteinase nas-4-like n=1 Tax=Topomyia yanbarensis TaxID=2498891 RepID=UPI00273AE21A|nr:zinc metalloproteinase nas-4-like [Topomyia yanbarensis]
MKILLIGLHVLAYLALVTNGLLYHPYEEIGRQSHGDLVVKTEDDPNTGESRLQIKRWTESTIPYLFIGNITLEHKTIIRDAMDEIQGLSCVRFVGREAKDKNFVIISVYESGCWSALGMHGGAQDLNLDPRGCMTKGSILHQLLHTLGFTHPSSRPDRDLYVRVVPANVNSHDLVYLDKADQGEINDFGIPYDFDSIMHRSGWAFSANGKQTIVSSNGDTELGQREKLSFKDIRKLNRMYSCEIY